MSFAGPESMTTSEMTDFLELMNKQPKIAIGQIADGQITNGYDRGSIARDEEICALLRRQVELLEQLVRGQAIAMARLMGTKPAPEGQTSMDQPLNPPRPKLSNE